jgi:hypothetical protein
MEFLGNSPHNKIQRMIIAQAHSGAGQGYCGMETALAQRAIQA